MSRRKCAKCGKDPAAGFASVWTAADGERWYCHPDVGPSCYADMDLAGAIGLRYVTATDPAVRPLLVPQRNVHPAVGPVDEEKQVTDERGTE